MEQIFMPLSTESTYKMNPPHVTAWVNPNTMHSKNPKSLEYDPCCPPKPKCKKKQKFATIEEEIRQAYAPIIEKAKIEQNKYKKAAKTKCLKDDQYVACVRLQRKPHHLKYNTMYRRKAIKTRKKLEEVRHDDTPAEKYLVEGKSLIKLQSPTSTGKVRVVANTSACSIFVIYKTPRRILDLHPPKSGILLNGITIENTEIPFDGYNPRILQQKADEILPHRLIERNDKYYVKFQENEQPEEEEENDENRWQPKPRKCNEPCCCLLYPETAPDLEEYSKCMQDPKLFPTPDDLQRWFKGTAILGSTRYKKEKDDVKEEEKRRRKSVAALYIAYGMTYTTLISEWETDTIDDILDDGEDLHEKSCEWYYEDAETQLDIIPELSNIQMTLKPSLFAEGSLNKDCECIAPNLLRSLCMFFRNGYACILLCGTLYLLIWRMCNGFCIFDPNGRNEKCERDWHTGKAGLMKTKPLEHVAHIILNISDLNPEEKYKLYEVRVVNFGAILKPIEPTYFNKKKRYYLVVSKNFAVIPGTEGMEPPEDSDDDNYSLFVALFGLLYSRIDPARHWTRKLIDNIIHTGEKYAKKYIKKHKLDNTHPNTLPTVLFMGNYRIDVEVKPFMYTGHLSECENYRYSPLTHFLKQFFTSFRCGILQIDQSSMAIWRDSDFFFVLDPFLRTLGGKVSIDDGECPVLHMHITLESLLRVLYRNGVDMMIDGNFFIHPVEVKSICYISRPHNIMPEQGTDVLKVIFPVSCEVKKEVSCSDFNPPSKPLPKNVPNECLSLLSISPCERACSESELYAEEKKEKSKARKKEVLEHVNSLESLPDSERIPEDDSGDIAIPVMEHIICLTIMELAAQSREKKKPRIKAEKVLLKTDLGYLQKLKRSVKRGMDYDNICTEFPPELPHEEMITLEDELKIPSNFLPLPDGIWMIPGLSNLMENDLILGVLGALVAAVLSRKYKISTWDSGIIDFAMTSAGALKEAYKPPNDVFALLLKKKIPTFEIGSRKYRIEVKKVKCGRCDSIADSLEFVLREYTCLILLFNTFSCTIFKRYNFFYLFTGFPCDMMGFRTAENGPPCFLRFQQFIELVKRINFNRCETNPDQGFIILSVHINDISPDAKNKFKVPSSASEELIYQLELEEIKKRERRNLAKIAFLDDEILKEKKRIELFKRLKEEKMRKGQYEEKFGYEMEEGRQVEEEDEIEEEGEEEEEKVEKKHKPGRALDRFGGGFSDKTKESIELGYRLREKDCIFKIQGTNAMESRAGGSTKEIRPCHFASMYAILFASLRPLNKWEFRRIDQVIERANELFDAIINKSTTCDRKVDNVRVDDYLFNVSIRALDPQNFRKHTDISGGINKIIENQQYFMLQLSNTTFAVYKDEYWHLFDPYKTLETLKEEDKSKEKKKTFVCAKGVMKYSDRNTASWVLFPTKETMIEYIDKRAESPQWKHQYRLHVVDVISFHKAPKTTRLLNFLLQEIFDEEDKPYEDLDCIPEEVKWLESDPIPWSRNCHTNIVGDKRGSSLALWKAYDIEIPNELFSLWGSLHPLEAKFKKSAGKQFLATNVIALCMANVYRVTEWNSTILDSIVINGDKYFNESIEGIRIKDYEFSLEDLNLEYEMNLVHFNIHIESVLLGKLYNRNRLEFDLSAGLVYFLMNYPAGIIQCLGRALAFGKANKGYFLFDCQNYGSPLFPDGQGSSYVLLSTTIKSLLYCMVRTLRIPYYNQRFVLHKVDIQVDKVGGEEEQRQEEEGENTEEEG